MIQPTELKKELPMRIANGVISTTTKVWEILAASRKGDLSMVKQLVQACHELSYAQYNYTPPIHFAVREGHIELVNYLLHQGAYDPNYKIYPFGESLVTIAQDRGFKEIERLLGTFPSGFDLRSRYSGDNGEIDYNRSEDQLAFEKAVDQESLNRTTELLKQHPEFALDETYFWGEGILTFAVKENNHKMIDLLMSYGARVPSLLKWAQFYYFERLDAAAYIMEKGMNPNTMSWHHVTILHDMAQKGFIDKAELLIKHGAAIDLVEEEFQSTPLGLAARWGQEEMVDYLLKQGANPNRSGAGWSTPLAWAGKKGYARIAETLLKAGAR